jgi:predicted GNAT superfamily acetyltransferase
MADFTIRILETPAEMTLVEDLQRDVWPGSETDIVPAHLLIANVHNGGVVIGAFVADELAGMVFGVPAFDETPDGPRPRHHSHMMGVREAYRSTGIGFALKRAQWQMVRHQGLDHITWTYDPLLSVNANLNIARLGAVCNTYFRAYYGEMRDGLNAGLPSDRFQVDWWIRTKRVERRLSKRPRRALDLDHFTLAGTPSLYPTRFENDHLIPVEKFDLPDAPLALMEIPENFLALKAIDLPLARVWRMLTRSAFEACFAAGYLVTDFVHDHGRSFYVLAHGEATI